MPFPFCIVGWCNIDVAARCMEAFSIGKLGRFTIKAIWFCVLENNLDYCGMGARSSSPTSSDSLSLSLFIKRIRMCSLDLAIAHIHRNHKPLSLPRIHGALYIKSSTSNLSFYLHSVTHTQRKCKHLYLSLHSSATQLHSLSCAPSLSLSEITSDGKHLLTQNLHCFSSWSRHGALKLKRSHWLSR